MKKARFFLPIAAILLSISAAWGQAAWKWGKPATANEVMRIATTGYGYSYVTGFSENIDTLKFGSISMWGQIYAAMVDSVGNFRWAVATNTKEYGTIFPDITFDDAGNAYMLGSYKDSTCTLGSFTMVNLSNSHASCMFIAKITPAGAVAWARNIGLGNAACLCADHTGNVYVAAGFFPTITIGATTLTSAGDYDICLVKYTTAGAVAWAKDIGGANADEPTAIRISDDYKIYLAGSFISSIPIGRDTLSDGASNNINPGKFIAKFDTSGKPVWAKDYSRYIDITRLASNETSVFYMAGNLSAAITMGSGSLSYQGDQDGFAAKCDTEGNVIWANSFGGLSEEYNYDMALDYCGNMWVCGKMGNVLPYTMYFGANTLTTPDSSNDPTYFAEYDSAGNYKQSFALVSGGDDYVGLSVDYHGSLYVSGDYVSSAIKFGTIRLPVPQGSSGESFFVGRYQYDTVDCYRPLAVPEPVAATEKILLYPNPAGDVLNIAADAPIDAVAIYDLMGRLVLEVHHLPRQATIGISGLRPGVYVARINNTEMRKFVKE